VAPFFPGHGVVLVFQLCCLNTVHHQSRPNAAVPYCRLALLSASFTVLSFSFCIRFKSFSIVSFNHSMEDGVELIEFFLFIYFIMKIVQEYTKNKHTVEN